MFSFSVPLPQRIAAALLAAGVCCGSAWAGPTGEPDPALRERLKAAITSAKSFDDRYEAEVWLLDYSMRLSPYLPDERARLEFLKLVHAEAKRAGLKPEVVLSVVHIESKFDRLAVSYAGAVGLMQIMPFWLTELGEKGSNLFKPEVNLRMGCTILRYYLDVERGDMAKALARYNGSVGRTDYSDKVLGVLNARWQEI